MEKKVKVESRYEFGQCMCEAHDDVNRKFKKRGFDYAKWEERQRAGWEIRASNERGVYMYDYKWEFLYNLWEYGGLWV